MNILEENTPNIARELVKWKNNESLSNGSIMRCMPLAVWASSIPDEEIFKKAIVADVSLSHPNILV